MDGTPIFEVVQLALCAGVPCGLLRLDLPFADHVGPLRELALDALLHLFRSGINRLGSDVRQSLTDLGVGDGLGEFLLQGFDQVRVPAENIQLQAGRAYCDRLIELHLAGNLDAASASAGKLWHSELLGRMTDESLQLHGGYGYMSEFPIAKAYVDARVERIYAGTSEIMKEIIARDVCDD